MSPPNQTLGTMGAIIVFNEIPRYQEIISRTLKLSPIFVIKKAHPEDEPSLVTLRGLDWNQLVEEMKGWAQLRAMIQSPSYA